MKILRIAVAVVLTLIMVIAARRYGPSHRYEVTGGTDRFSLYHKAPRGHDGEGPALIELMVKLNDIEISDLVLEMTGKVKGASEEETFLPASTEKAGPEWDYTCIFEIPHKPVTTRYHYKFQGRQKGDDSTKVVITQDNGDPMMVKFKGPVPSWILIPHILAMFAGLFLLIWSSLYSISLMSKNQKSPNDEADPKSEAGRSSCILAWWAFAVLFIGGVPIGFAMNYYAFDVYWEAWPFGGDVTDNKTQIALIIWGAATLGLTFKKNPKTGLATVIAGILVLMIYLVPHSLQL